MTKAELIAKVQEVTESSKSVAEKAVNTVFESLRGEFLSGKDVSFVGFGTFKVTERAARTARNPKTGESVKVEAKKTITFKPAAISASSM